jgi:hypothetical protein
LNRAYIVQNGNGITVQSNGCGATGQWRGQIQYQPAFNATGLMKTVSTRAYNLSC